MSHLSYAVEYDGSRRLKPFHFWYSTFDDVCERVVREE